jgi:hypothetical protein
MIPVQFPESNGVLAGQQDEYEPIAIYAFHDEQGRVVCCFRLSDAEIEEIVRTRTVWLQQLTFGQRFQPIGLSTQRPDDLPQSAGERKEPISRQQRAANYQTHKPRYSDSSLYDEVCTVCGARDYCIGPDELSDRPCTTAQSAKPQ